MKPRLPKILVLAVVLFVAGYLVSQALTTVMSPYLSIAEVRKNPGEYFGKEIQMIGNVTGPLSGGVQGLDFTLTEDSASIQVTYTGPIPQNFKEGIRVVVIGKLNTDGQLVAEQILTKCPSKYTA